MLSRPPTRFEVRRFEVRRPLVIAAAVALHGLAIYALIHARQPAEQRVAETLPLTLIIIERQFPETGAGEVASRPWQARDLPPPTLSLTQPTITLAPPESMNALGEYIRCGLPREFWLQDRERCEQLRAQVQNAPTPVRKPTDREIQMVAKFERQNIAQHTPTTKPCIMRRAKGSSARCGTEPTWRDEDF